MLTIYLLGISRENRKFPENFLFCFDFTINSKYVILPPIREVKQLYLPLTRENRKFSGITRDVFGFKME